MITDAPFPPEPVPGAPSSRAPAWARPRVWGTLLRLVRHVVLATVVGMALLGALDTHWLGMVLLAPALGAFFAAAVALVDSDFPREVSSRRAVAYAFATGALLVPFGNGMVMLGSTGGAAFMGLLVIAPFLLGGWMLEAADAAAPDVDALEVLLPTLPTAQLLHEWRATEDLLRSARQRTVAAEVRALLLDELSTRDPDGVAAWLAAGGGPPEAFIRSDRDLTG